MKFSSSSRPARALDEGKSFSLRGGGESGDFPNPIIFQWPLAFEKLENLSKHSWEELFAHHRSFLVHVAVPSPSSPPDTFFLRKLWTRRIIHSLHNDFHRAAPGTDPNALAPAAPAVGEDGEVVGGPRYEISRIACDEWPMREFSDRQFFWIFFRPKLPYMW